MNEIIRIKAILTDLDGIIFRTEHLQRESWLPSLEQFGVGLSEEYYRNELAGNSTIEIADKIINKYKEEGVNIDMIPEELLHEKEKLLLKWVDEKPPELLPYAKKFMNYAVNNWSKFGMVTGSSMNEAMLKLDKSGLYNIVKDVPLVTKSHPEVKKGKPAPYSYLVGMKEIGSKPEETAVIEDSGPGLESAKSAGVKEYIGVPHELVSVDSYPAGTILLNDLNSVIKHFKVTTFKPVYRN